jgi:predicted solute-binding protein
MLDALVTLSGVCSLFVGVHSIAEAFLDGPKRLNTALWDGRVHAAAVSRLM